MSTVSVSNNGNVEKLVIWGLLNISIATPYVTKVRSDIYEMILYVAIKGLIKITFLHLTKKQTNYFKSKILQEF